MLSETLEEGLQEYEIGEKIRKLRLRKKMGLLDLGTHTGLSPAMLSKIERGRLYPTLPTLLRIALAFGVSLEHFFQRHGPKEPSVVRAGEPLKFDEKMGGATPSFTFECLDYKAVSRKLNAYRAEFPEIAAEHVRTHHHDGAEFIFVLSGHLAVNVDGEETVLNQGDAMYFETDVAHGYRAVDTPACAAVVVTVS